MGFLMSRMSAAASGRRVTRSIASDAGLRARRARPSRCGARSTVCIQVTGRLRDSPHLGTRPYARIPGPWLEAPGLVRAEYWGALDAKDQGDGEAPRHRVDVAVEIGEQAAIGSPGRSAAPAQGRSGRTRTAAVRSANSLTVPARSRRPCMATSLRARRRTHCRSRAWARSEQPPPRASRPRRTGPPAP